MQPFAHNNAVSKQCDGTRVWGIPKIDIKIARTDEDKPATPAERFVFKSGTYLVSDYSGNLSEIEIEIWFESARRFAISSFSLFYG